MATAGSSRTTLPRLIACYWLRLLIFAALFTVTLEICARLDDCAKYGAPFWEEYSNGRLRSRDKLGFTYNLPNAKFEKWEHNSLGFRGAERDKSKKPGMTRVVCLGSSESYGLYESPGKEWPAQLQALLPGTRYEVLNASVVGLNLKYFEPYLQKHVFPLKPDVVILVVNPLFYVTNQISARMEESGPTGPAAKEKPSVASCKEKLLANVRVFPKLKQVIKQAVVAAFPDTYRTHEIVTAKRQLQEIERNRLKGGKPLETVPAPYLANFGGDLGGIVDLIRSHNSEVILTS